MYNILIVDDEEMIRKLVQKYASFEGHTVFEAKDGMEVLKLVKSNNYDIIIMDIMMPELDGFSCCREIRKFSNIPIIMLSARGEEYDKINAFNLSVDDYVVKPFSPKELMLRIDAVMKRYNSGSSSSDNSSIKNESEHHIETYEGLKVDFTARIVYVDDVRVELSPKEYDLLFYMIKNKNIALSRERFINEVWGYEYFGDDRTLDTHIKLLRRNLGNYAKYIVTLRGVGYRFDTSAK